MHKRKILLFILLFLTVITFLPLYSQAQAVNLRSSETQSVTDNTFDESRALSILYEGFIPGKKEARWIMPKNDMKSSRRTNLVLFPGGKEVVSTVLQSVHYIEGGQSKVLFLTKTRPDDFTCHACSPLIGGAIFIHDDTGWVLGAINKFIVSMGDSGEVRSLGKLVRIGNDKYGILFDLGDCHQGICYSYNVLIGEANGKLIKLLWIESTSGIAEDGCVECDGKTTCKDCWSFKSEIRYVNVKGNDYDEIEVVTAGTKEGPERIGVPFNQVRRYKFVEGFYKLEQ